MKMMRKLIYTSIAFCTILVACSRRTVPSSTKNEGKKIHPRVTPDRTPDRQYVKKATIIDSATVAGNQNPLATNQTETGKVITDSYNKTNAGAVTEGTPTNPAGNATVADSANLATNYLMEPAVVIDSRGNLLIDTFRLPPTVSHNLDSLNQTIRAFTPAQAKNLAYRFKQIPPRVLYIPDNLAKPGRNGMYYKYNNKFWYWKKADGFFYLDENYYK